LEVQF